eukprot:CAMPEP_0168734772 /NCGR_PEP_ID=MMETSP0724-20121128/8988_1 /TAXON_ID=265536 /ORGANISM="Amphiprora sp., Strain CCMP467" /LENGTH=183 /DNA_ID=CAMNT_0008781891 /DNA_START=264 /DNA_END=815 /DNA_ORIENTATION=+
MTTSNIAPPTSQQQATTNQTRRTRYDATAKRPNKICDPYGQQGRPMAMEQALLHHRDMLNSNDQWVIVPRGGNNDNSDSSSEQSLPPLFLTRDLEHPSYLAGAEFGRKIAAVAVVHNHYPISLQLRRKIVRKQWKTITTVQCQTLVLGGLSTMDFHLAMMIDIELNRPELQQLIVDNDNAAKE